MAAWPRRVVPTTAIAGLATGIAMALGWRYIAYRRLTIVSPKAPAGSDKPGYMFTFDYLEYRGGLSWWPVVVVGPVIGVCLGVAVGLLLTLGLRIGRWNSRGVSGALWTVIVIASLGAGAVTAAITQSSPPTMQAAAVTDPAYVLDLAEMEAVEKDPVKGAPPRLHLLPPHVALPLLGGAAALLGGAAAQAVSRVQRRSP